MKFQRSKQFDALIDVDAQPANATDRKWYGDGLFVCESVREDKYGRLILAAPALYEACDKIAKLFGSLKDPTADEKAALKIATAALADARGEAPTPKPT